MIGCLAGQLRAVLDNFKNGKVDSRPFYSNLFPYECNGSRIVVSFGTPALLSSEWPSVCEGPRVHRINSWATLRIAASQILRKAQYDGIDGMSENAKLTTTGSRLHLTPLVLGTSIAEAWAFPPRFRRPRHRTLR